GPGLRGSDRSERRHREQDRHVWEGSGREGEPDPVLRRGTDEHDRLRLGIGRQDPDRGAVAAGSPPPRRPSNRAEGEPRPQPGVRRDAGEVHHGHHHGGGDREAGATAIRRGERASEENAREETPVGPYAFTGPRLSPDPVLLLTTWFGSFLLDGDKIVHQRLFPSDAARLADRLALVEDWKVLDEERELMGLADEVFVVEPRLERAGGNRTSESPPFLRSEDFGYGRDLLHGAMVDLAKRRMRKAIRPEDHLRQAVG